MDNSTIKTIPVMAFYILDAGKRLVSPQHYIQSCNMPIEFIDRYTFHHKIHNNNNNYQILVKKNLPMIIMWNSLIQREHNIGNVLEPCAVNENNLNLTPPQKELFPWYF